jgi:hypothetical protein
MHALKDNLKLINENEQLQKSPKTTHILESLSMRMNMQKNLPRNTGNSPSKKISISKRSQRMLGKSRT